MVKDYSRFIKSIPPFATVSVPLVLGILLLFEQSELPSPYWAAGLLPLVLVSHRVRWLRPLLWLLVGYIWAAVVSEGRLEVSLPGHVEGQDLAVTGTVVGVPQRRGERSIRFRLQIDAARFGDQDIDFPGLVRLNWYIGDAIKIHPGERWQLLVRLKQPHGFLNPGGFDWERWLFQQGIRATGYVRKSTLNRRLGDGSASVDQLRQKILMWMKRQDPSERSGVLTALAVGDRHQMTPEIWELFRKTGTNHLMAISGLHVGMVSALLFFLFRWGWSLVPRLLLYLPAQQAGAVGGLLGALGYAMLAGFSIPTQRALVMVSVVLVALLLRRSIHPWNLFFMAMALLLLWDPLVVLSAGFWLSFSAVGLILFGVDRSKNKPWWRIAWNIQWVLLIGLLPLLLFLFRQGSMVAPFANLIAVPWVSMVVVPLDLMAVLLFSLQAPGAEWLLQMASLAMALLLPMLQWMATLEISLLQLHQPPLWVVLSASVGALVMMATSLKKRGWMGILLYLPLFLVGPPRPEPGEAVVTVLDVGQGLSVVVEGREQVMVYDTGDRFSDRFDAGSAVVVPFLQSKGWREVDLLVVGHGDRDHIGGVDALLEALPVNERISSVPDRVDDAVSCQSGMSWQWGGVMLKVIHPQYPEQFEGNDGSCVIRVESANGDSVLLTGDIERTAEQSMLKQEFDLQVSGVVVPHHGSATSSSEAWLDRVNPQWAIFPLGYRNRFQFPKEEVVERYRKRNIPYWVTARDGAVEIRLGKEIFPNGWRPRNKRIWSDS